MVREGLLCNVTFEKDLKGGWGTKLIDTGGEVFQAKGKSSDKALSWEHTQHVLETARRSMVLEQTE